MERGTAVRKPNSSNADLLTWSDDVITTTPSFSSNNNPPSSHQPSDGISKVVFGGQITDEESQNLNKRKPCSGYKLKEITGSKIFAEEDGETDSGTANANSTNKTGLRIYQQAVNGISQISFSVEEKVSPKKPSTLPEVAKQRELSGTVETEADLKIKKQTSDAKYKELTGNDIFAPAPDVLPRSLAAAARSLETKDMGEPAPRNVRTSVKVSNPTGGQSNILFGDDSVVTAPKKIHNQKFAELTGNDIFKGGVVPGSAEKPLSSAKLREMSGNDIFSDGNSQPRELLGHRKPPGGDSSISLV